MGIELTAKHLARKDNVQAEHLSRLLPHYEWQLTGPLLFQSLRSRLRTPFRRSLRKFHKYPCISAPAADSITTQGPASGVDAIAQLDWTSLNNYVNPPFRLILRILQIIQEQSRINSHIPMVASSALVSDSAEVVNLPATSAPQPPTHLSADERRGQLPRTVTQTRGKIHVW